MNRIRLAGILAVLAIATYLLMSSIYTVSEVQQAIITQFGRPVGDPVTSAGLKFKVPFIQDVNLIDKRVLEWDGNPSDMPTKDKLYVSVDLFARWRIVEPLQYFLRLHDERSAQSRLDDVLGSETRNAVAKHELIEIIRTTRDRVPLRDVLVTDAARLDVGSLVPIQKGRKQVEQEIFAEAAQKVRVFGIELLDIRFKRINYNESVRPKIYDRMISERRQIAERFLSEGNGEAARIRGNRVRDMNKIQSEATGRSRRSAAWRTRRPPKSTPRPTTRVPKRSRSMNSHGPCRPTSPSSPKTRPLCCPRTATCSSS
jgi:membrane protease subunit HflC